VLELIADEYDPVEQLGEMGGGNTFGLAATSRPGPELAITAPRRIPSPHSLTKMSTRNGENRTIGLRSRERSSTSPTHTPFVLPVSCSSYSIFRRKVKRGRGIEAAGTLYFHVDSLGDLL